MVNRPRNFLRDIIDVAHEMKSRGDVFAMATVVKTVSLTAAKPGAKAILDKQGNIVEGWIGGGCAMHAVKKAAINAIADGRSRHVSITPEELMQDDDASILADDPQHVQARNMCPSKGSMEIFVEPMLSNPSLLVIGASPVALALGELASLFDFDVSLQGLADTASNDVTPYQLILEPDKIDKAHSHRYIVVATQGGGDLQALSQALALESRLVAFVGSSKKITHLKSKLTESGLSAERLQNIQCPAGKDIHAVTPQEIALSILADIIQRRRS